MTTVLTALVALCLLVAVGGLLLLLLAVAPFVVGVDMAERRGFSADRWGALCLLGLGLAAGLGLVVHTADLSRLLYLPVAGLAWATPGVLALLAPGQRIGGPQGVHEH